MEIRNTTLEDLKTVLDIYKSAREFMKKTGNPSQWKDNSPAVDSIINDIKNNNSYVILEDNKIHAVFSLIIGEDITYKKIYDGKFLSDSLYGTIHKVASDNKIHNVFKAIVDFSLTKIKHLRIDTHKDNKIMQHLILKNGFNKVGIIHLLNGEERIAFERL